MNNFLKDFERGSAAIDWCENNYAVVAGIAEFYNVVSNVLFLLMPPLLLYLFRQYARQVNPSVNIMWILLMVVGASSVYFHSTLSMFGQLLDEIAILWVVWCGIALWYPKRYYPSQLKGNRKYFKLLVFMCSLGSTALAMIHPAVNSYFMFMFVPPSVYMLYLELQRTTCRRVSRLGKTCAALWIIAVSCWLCDMFMCNVWQAISFPYLHCAWHLIVFISAYTGIVLFAYFDAMNECPEMGPQLKYWPNDNWITMGVPYVALTCGGSMPHDD